MTPRVTAVDRALLNELHDKAPYMTFRGIVLIERRSGQGFLLLILTNDGYFPVQANGFSSSIAARSASCHIAALVFLLVFV
jgi:hypothetical protein